MNARTARRTADKLWSEYIRQRGACERCGSRAGLQAAHIVRRSHQATRCDPANGWCLCAECHPLVDTDVDVFGELVVDTIGVDELKRLDQLSRDGEGDRYRADHWITVAEDLRYRLGKVRR